jgi:hypothetical protein
MSSTWQSSYRCGKTLGGAASCLARLAGEGGLAGVSDAPVSSCWVCDFRLLLGDAKRGAAGVGVVRVVPDEVSGSLSFDGRVGWFCDSSVDASADTVVCGTSGRGGSILGTAAATEAVGGSIARDWVEASFDP